MTSPFALTLVSTERKQRSAATVLVVFQAREPPLLEHHARARVVFEPEADSEVSFLSGNIFLPPLDSNKESPVLLEHKPETKNMVFTYLNNDEEEEIELQQKSSIATDMIED